MDEVMQIKFRIQRYNPENGAAPHMDEFTIPVTRGTTVLDALFYIKENLDSSVAFRSSCRMAICGSCAMLMNNKPNLACHTQVEELKSDTVELKPTPNYRIIRDLVVDLTPLFEKHRKIKPYLIRAEAEELQKPTAEFQQSPEELDSYLQFSYCVKCGLCLGACPTAASDRQFTGPQALTQCFRYSSDSRDDGAKERFPAVDGEHGMYHCHLAGACSEACPKGVDPALAIQLLKRLRVRRSLGLGRKRRPAPLVPPPAATKPRLPVPEFTVSQPAEKEKLKR